MTKNPHEYYAEVFYQGDYFAVEATLKGYGEYTVEKDDSGQEWVVIDEEPSFSDLTIYHPDDYVMDNPDDALAEAALEMLKEIYWIQEEI